MRGDGEKTGYRKRTGYRNGYRPGKVKIAEGAVDSAPQVRDTAEPFVSGVRAALSGPRGSLNDWRSNFKREDRLVAGSKEDVETVRAVDARHRGHVHG